MRVIFLVMCALLAGGGLDGWVPEKWFESPRSDRSVCYKIRGVLDWPQKKFEGSLVLTWKNNGDAPTQDLPFHLYLNVFRNPDTALMKTQKIVSDTRWGYCEITSASINGIELSGRAGTDETTYWYRLPRPVRPGESIEIHLAWESKFPEIQFGSGWTGRYLVASMWYPKLGIYRNDHWICDSFNGDAVFQGNFGNYDVELSLPNALQLANTGTICIPVDESGEPLTDKQGIIVEAAYDPERKLNFIYKIHAEDVQDFSWIAAPNGSWGMSRLDIGDLNVFIYSIPKNATQLGRLRYAIKEGLRSLEERFGPYPYPILSIVDLPAEAHGAIVSPTLAVLSNVVFDPFNQYIVPERAILQQLGDQLFRGVLASDNRSGNLLNAQLSAWYTNSTMEQISPGLISSFRFQMDHDFPGRYSKWLNSLPSLKNGNSALSRCFPLKNVMSNSSMAIDQLDKILGKRNAQSDTPVLEDVVRAYYLENAFKYPGHDDFRKIAEKFSEQDLGSFWESYIVGQGTLDYRIQSVTRSGAITLERRGDIIVPITLWVRLENGHERTHLWDGQGSSVIFNFEVPISEAKLDPDQKYPSLKSRMHTTYTAKPKRRGLHYWAQQLFGAITGVLQGIGVG